MIKLINNYNTNIHNSIHHKLPEPSQHQLEHSNKLTNIIIDNIKYYNNWLSFKDYMDLALYHPIYGYYTSNNSKIGPTGDFITAPEIGPLFAYTIAKQISPIIKDYINTNQEITILEFGAGTGQLAYDLLTQLDKLNSLPNKYYIIDLSPDLKNRQQKKLTEIIKKHKNKLEIIWLDKLPEDNNSNNINSIVIANEVLDAMPVNIFQVENNMIYELGMSLKNNHITWAANQAEYILEQYLESRIIPIINQNNQNINYISEVNLLAENWLNSISNYLNSGLIILVDYGFARSDYYNSSRTMGTLMCHYKHYAHQDPLLYPGLQDITAHVDFTTLTEATIADDDLEVLGFYNQASFLIANDITSFVDNSNINNNISYNLALKQQIKKLTATHEMGELFKVLLLGKNLDYKYFEHLDIYDRSGML